MAKFLYKQKGSNNWRIRFRIGGQRVNESTDTPILSEAKSRLDERRQQVRDGTYAPRTAQLTIAEIAEAKLAADKINNLDSYQSTEARWRLHLEPVFGGMKAIHLSTETINKYIAKRLEAKAAPATINREIALMRGAFNLAKKSGRLKTTPWFPSLREDNIRTGFLDDSLYQKLAVACSSEGIWLRGIFEVCAQFAWRSTSVRTLRVRQIDFGAGTIRLDDTKNDSGVTAVMTTVIRQVLEVCCAGKGQDDFVFTYSDGKPVLNFRLAWIRACKAAGCPALLVHDLARTGMRNLRRLGISEGVCMKIAGRKSPSIFRRYDIVSQDDLADAAKRLDEKQKNLGMVVGIVPVSEKPKQEQQAVQVPLVQ
jgi:integrase